jgi:hypothetical protein
MYGMRFTKIFVFDHLFFFLSSLFAIPSDHLKLNISHKYLFIKYRSFLFN